MNVISICRKSSAQADCLAHLELARQEGLPTCPHCKTRFSATVGTIFHDTKMDLREWFLALSLILLIVLYTGGYMFV